VGVAVLRDLIQLLLYALLAAFSPLAVAATMTAIQAGRRQALGFGVGFVAAQLVTCALFVILDFAAVGSSRRSYPGIRAPLALVLAGVLLWLASRVRRRPPPTHESNSRAHALLARLSRLGYLTTLAVGMLLGIGGPKRLVLTALAAALVATSGAGDSSQAELVVVYAALATALVWAPIVFYVVRGEKAVALMKAAQDTASRHQPKVTIYALRGLAALLVIDAIGVVLTHGG
jgi:Na+/melibiose symporter-like transporter